MCVTHSPSTICWLSNHIAISIYLKQRRHVLSRVGFPLIVIAFSLIITVNNPRFFGMGMSIICIALLFGLFFPLFGKNGFARRFQKAHQGDTTEEFTFSIDEKGISSGSSKGKTDLFWNTIKDVVATNTLIFFFYTPICAIVVPKSAIGNKQDYDI